MDLKIRIKQTSTGTLTLAPAGPINNETSSTLEKAISEIAAKTLKTVVLDLADVAFVSSAGVGAIAKAKTDLKKVGASLAITNPQPQVKKVFEVMQLLPSLNVFENTDELDEYLERLQRRITGDDDIY